MDTAAGWAAISAHASEPSKDRHASGASLVTNLTWAQQHQNLNAAAPLFGSRRTWRGYTCETTGYGSLELRGSLAHRVTIVLPGDAETLRRHHRLVRSGHLTSARPWRRCDPSRIHVIERDGLSRTRADDRGSWLVDAQRIAQLCGTDDEVARTAGPSLCRLLWWGREHLDSEHIRASLSELRGATETLTEERRRYAAAVERKVRGDGRRASSDPRFRLEAVDLLAQQDLESIRLEILTLAAVQSEWDGAAAAAQHHI